MLLRLSLPDLPAGASRVRVSSWRVAPGDRVAFGDLIAEVTVLERDRLRRSSRARDILRRARSGSDDGASTIESRAVHTSFDLLASDGGFVRAHLAGPGDVVDRGAALAIVTTSADEPFEASQAPSAPQFRVVAEPSEAER